MAKRDHDEPVTRGLLDEAVRAILGGIDNMFTEQDKRFDGLEAKVDQVKSELKDEIEGLKAELSDTPSRRDMDKLKEKVERHHPAN